MKKYLWSIILLVIVFSAPQIALASWWNPFTWKVFHREESKTEILENRIKELEGKLQKTSTSSVISTPTTTTIKKVTAPPTIKKVTPKIEVSSLEDVQSWTQTIDEFIISYKNSIATLKDNSYKVTQFMNNYIEKIEKMDSSGASLLLASTLTVTTSNQEMIESLNTKIAELQRARSEMVATNMVNKAVWNNSKIQELRQFSTYITNTEDGIVKEYLKNKQDIYQLLELILGNLKSNYSSSPSSVSVQQNPYNAELSAYNQKLSDMKAQLTKEYEAAGGFWTASQLESNAISKLKEMGIKPPTSPYGGYINPSGSYNSIQCNSLNGGYDCYGSNGTRIQSNPIPGGNSFQIDSW